LIPKIFIIFNFVKKNYEISEEKISKGGILGTPVEPKIIFMRTRYKHLSVLLLIDNHHFRNMNVSWKYLTSKLESAEFT